jgi:two-component system sensor histidine kinase FlrB
MTNRQMLPTSHRSPRNSAFADPAAEAESLSGFDPLAERGAEAEHQPIAGASLLADAFSEFIAAAARLEGSYAELQGQVAHLSLELAERNAALNASLAENERMRLALQQIVDSMPCGVLVLENDGALSMINPEGMRLLDLAPLQIQGQARTKKQAHRNSLGAISTHAGIDLASFVADERIPDGEQEFSVAGPAGKRWIEVRNRRLYTHDDIAGSEAAGRRASQTILILRDVTAHKQAEQERERGRRATALAEVAAMLAHEIRNPLASMELFAGLLGESESVSRSQGSERQWISHMHAGIRSLSGTVNNVLSFHGAGFPALTPVSLASAIGSSVEFVRPIADQSGVALEFTAEPGETLVLGNASGLQQVVLNLVSNAVRHTPKGGRVRVSVHTPEPGCARIEFADTGSGIRAEQLAEIFRPGFSGSGNTSGLGLAVCGQIVRQHGGQMRVSSKLGSGTTFYVELPTL